MIGLHFFIVTINIGLVLFQISRELRRKSPFLFFWIGLCAVFLIPSYSDVFAVNINAHPHSVSYILSVVTVVYAQIICLIFLILYMALDYLFISKSFSLSGFNFDFAREDVFYLGALLLIGVSLLIPFVEVWNKFGASFLGGFGFEDRREGVSSLSSFLLGYGMKIAAALGVVFWVLNKRVLFLLVASVFFLVFVLLGGSRQPLIFLIAPLVAHFCFLSRRPLVTLLFVFSIIYIFSGAFDVLIYLRNLSGFDARVAALSNFGETLSEAVLRPSTASIRFAFYYFIQEGGRLEGFFDFSYMARLSLFWLPSSFDFMGIKPDDFEYTMFYHYMMGREGTAHPTFFGSIYADSGPLFFLWSFVLFGINFFLLKILSNSRGVKYLILWTVMAGSFIMWARGAIYGPVVVIFVSYVFCSLVSAVCSLLIKKRYY